MNKASVRICSYYYFEEKMRNNENYSVEEAFKELIDESFTEEEKVVAKRIIKDSMNEMKTVFENRTEEEIVEEVNTVQIKAGVDGRLCVPKHVINNFIDTDKVGVNVQDGEITLTNAEVGEKYFTIYNVDKRDGNVRVTNKVFKQANVESSNESVFEIKVFKDKAIILC